MAVVGPGAQQDITEDVPSLLEDATEFEYVTILNPLTDDFAVRVAQDIPMNLPVEIRAKTGLVQSASDVVRSYGLDLKNPDFKSRKHVYNDTVIAAGHTKRFKGNEAKVAVRQLVNEVLQRRGNKRLMADPTLRRQVEEEIVVERGNVQDLMDIQLQTQRSQIDVALARANEADDEQPFPSAKQDKSTGGNAEHAQANGEGSRRSLGNSKKTNN
jgi:hypothetical protein